MIEKLKNKWRHIRLKQRHPDVLLEPSCHIVDAAVQSGSILRRSCHISSSQIGKMNEVGRETSIINSQTGDNCQIQMRSHISSSKIDDNSKVLVKGRMHNAQLGVHSTLGCQSQINDSKLSSYSYLGDLSVAHNTQIGKFCSIGREFHCGLGTHPTNFVSSSPIFYSGSESAYYPKFSDTNTFQEFTPTTIGNDVWIGSRVTLLDGVKIGNGAVIAAGSIVNKDVAPFTIVGGIPAKPIRMRFAEDIVDALQSIEWWNWPEEKIHEAQALIGSNEIHSFIEWAQKHK